MANKKTWSYQEAAILLENYIKVLNGELPRLNAVKRVSDDLRKMAVNNGIEIDDIFRNRSGISFQMFSMESAYHGVTIMKPASRLFKEVVALYNCDHDRYEELLKEAKAMIGEKNNYIDAFSSWTAINVPTIPSNILFTSLSTVERFCLKLKVLKAPIFETTDWHILKSVQKTISQNKRFRFINKKKLRWIDASVTCLLKFIEESNAHQDIVISVPAQDTSSALQSGSHTKIEAPHDLTIITEPYVRTKQDRTLATEYPLIYKKIFSALYKCKKAITVSELYDRINHMARYTDIEDILNKVSWSRREHNTYMFSGEVISHDEPVSYDERINTIKSKSPAVSAVNTAEIQTNIVNFNYLGKYSYTRPTDFSYFGNNTADLTSWTDLYVKLFFNLYKHYPTLIPVNVSFTDSGRIDFGNKDVAKTMTDPKHICMQMYLETNYSATVIINKIKALLDICNIDYSNVVIKYQNKRIPNNVQQDKPADKVKIRAKSTKDFDILFSDWLQNTEKLAKRTCRCYIAALSTAETFAKEHHFPSVKIRNVNIDEAMNTITCLLADKEFCRINREQHNCCSAAFQKIKKYYNNFGPVETDSVDTSETYRQEKEKIKVKSRKNTPSGELADAVSLFLKEHNDGVSKEAILAHFNKYTTQQINFALLSCHAIKVLKKYYHKDNISDFDEMADILLDVILKQFAANGDYTSAQLLYNEVHCRLDDFFFYNNAFESRAEIYDIAMYLFAQENYKGYSFLFMSGIHIWKHEPDYPKDFYGLLIKYAREHHNIFTREQAIEYFRLIGCKQPEQTSSLMIIKNGWNTFLQYDKNCFVLKSALNVNSDFLNALKVQIEALLDGESYIAFGEINDYFYTTLPLIPANIQWTPLLIEDMLRIFDIGYTTIDAGNDNDKKTIPAAILKKNSEFKTFSDLVWNEISKTYTLPKEFSASDFREFLLEKGFIHGSEKMLNVHRTVAGDLHFYWTENNSKVTIN